MLDVSRKIIKKIIEIYRDVINEIIATRWEDQVGSVFWGSQTEKSTLSKIGCK